MLFLVLMIVAFSSLAATFAVQDSSYALSATRNAKEYTLARYAAESGVNTLPALVADNPDLRNDLDDDGTALAVQTADGGLVEPYVRLHLPQPDGGPQTMMNHKHIENELFDAGAGASLAHNLTAADESADLPREAIYEALVEGSRSGSVYHYTISTFGRVTSRWNDATGDFDEPAIGDVRQDEDENWYHEVVSVSRGYYTKF